MGLKKLEVPTSSITEVKKSPMDVFDQAREAATGVYIFNREKIAGVMLTQELYEGLIQELDELRVLNGRVIAEEGKPESAELAEDIEDITTPEIFSEAEEEPAGVAAYFKRPPVVEEKNEVPLSPELAVLSKDIEQSITNGSVMAAKLLDNRLVSLGFITKKSGFGGVTDLMNELKETGKVIYRMRGKIDNSVVYAEVIGEPDGQSQFLDKVIVRKIHVFEE